MNKLTTGIIGIIITLVIQTVGMVWWAASLNAQVNRNTEDIAELRNQFQTSATVILTRDQLNDILGVRDEQIRTIQTSINRLENKLDLILK